MAVILERRHLLQPRRFGKRAGRRPLQIAMLHKEVALGLEQLRSFDHQPPNEVEPVAPRKEGQLGLVQLHILIHPLSLTGADVRRVGDNQVYLRSPRQQRRQQVAPHQLHPVAQAQRVRVGGGHLERIGRDVDGHHGGLRELCRQ